MNWEDLQFFLTIARSGSLSGAARVLGVNQATVSRRLASLEGQLNVRLVDRLAREQPDLPQFVMVPDRAAGAVPLGRSVHRARTFTGLLHEVLAVATASVDG